FAYPPDYGTPEEPKQSLISDLIPQGMCGGNGYVSEPDVKYATYPNVLFSRYVQGYNMAESFLAATPRLYWKAVTVGDPLMAPYATPPSVSITAPDPARPAHGVVAISADGTDASGIKKVEFYIDDQLVQSCDASPYRMDWNTCTYTEGMHTVEAIAYENSDVQTQGMASVQIDVRNSPLEVSSISHLALVPVGRLVRLTSKIVIAGTDVFVDGVYVVEPDRSAGIRILDITSVETGARVSVEGEIDVVDGQRVLRAATIVPEQEPLLLTADVTYAGDGTPAALTPFAMPNKFIANRGSNAGPEYSGLRSGLPNCALLVKTWGRVVRTGDMAFYISDGSMVLKFAPIQDLKVSLKNLASPVNAPAVGSFVEVTGVSCYELEGNLRWPTVRPRSESDIRIIPL
ncbi:MAG: Ig-like domain-containing protein, partial [Armatimonadetes bacterium]|nr:Ig-like domain-containing protein [Armatimonadota bacterium]